MATSKRKKGESPKAYASRRTKTVDPDAGRFPGQGVLEAVLTGLAFIPAVAITAVAAEAAEEAKYQRQTREAERELERLERERQRVLERLGRNVLSREGTEKERYITQRLSQLNSEIARETSYFKRSILQSEKERLENELFG